MKRRTCELLLAVWGRYLFIGICCAWNELGSGYDDDVDGTGECRGVYVLVVLVRDADCIYSTPKIIHEDGGEGLCAVQARPPQLPKC